MTAGLSANCVSFRYGRKLALDSVSCEIPMGSFCALLGPNGAGKSTLVSLLTRLLVTSEGAIHIAGHNLDKSPRRALARLGIVFQQQTLDMDLTVNQNLGYFAALHGLPRSEVPRRIDAALDKLGMRDRANEKIRELNGGHRRRTELARSLLHDPAVLLLDEPTVGLDAASRRKITDEVHDLAKEGLCVLWTTHLTDEIRDADNLLVLHHGKVMANGKAGDVRGNLPLAEWFLSRTEDSK